MRSACSGGKNWLVGLLAPQTLAAGMIQRSVVQCSVKQCGENQFSAVLLSAMHCSTLYYDIQQRRKEIYKYYLLYKIRK